MSRNPGLAADMRGLITECNRLVLKCREAAVYADNGDRDAMRLVLLDMSALLESISDTVEISETCLDTFTAA